MHPDPIVSSVCPCDLGNNLEIVRGGSIQKRTRDIGTLFCVLEEGLRGFNSGTVFTTGDVLD